MRPAALFLAGVVALAGVPAAAQKFPDGKVFATPPSTMMSEGKAKFAQGAVMFQRAWKFLEAPVDWNAVFAAGEQGIPGLGPLYNQLSCVGCHARNGRGAAPGEGEAIGSMVVRFSVKGHDEHGGPKPHPAYGSQLNPNGGPDVPGEGDALLRYQSHIETLADGEKVELRAPRLEYRGLNYGPIGPDTMTSIRNAPAVAGLGLLAQAPEEALRAIARQSGGRLNMVWDRETQKTVIGRFGWKANQPSILQQVANAFSEDMGVSSRLFPLENCTGAQTACLIRSTQEMSTELPDEQMEAIAFYLSNLAPPPRRNADAPATREGQAVFARIGCNRCHRESLPLAGGGEIAPYTDLALHDMGEGLGDGRADFKAGPRDWRTSPLWGLGASVGDSASYLHDGRARNFAEAILWHGGEAKAAREGYRALLKTQRDALQAFLESL